MGQRPSQCCGHAGFVGLIAALAASASASSPLIVEYSFPLSWNGSGVVADLSPAGNNSIAQGTPATSTAIPSGATGKSITTNSGGVLTNYATEDALLSNAYVANYGGFSYDTWFRWDGTSTAYPTQKIIDYSGTESLQLFNPAGKNVTAGEEVQFAFNGATDAADAITFPVSANVWYHAVATFDTGTNAIAANGSLAGTATFSINTGSGPTTATLSVSKTNAGDLLVRPIAIGTLGLPNSTPLVDFDGQIFNPTVALGVVPQAGMAGLVGAPALVLPEPASLGFVCLAAPLLLRRRRVQI